VKPTTLLRLVPKFRMRGSISPLLQYIMAWFIVKHCVYVLVDGRGPRVRFPARAGNFSLHYRVQDGSGAHPASDTMGTRGSSLGVKRPKSEADHSPPSSAEVRE
jgi:hypothetical protein